MRAVILSAGMGSRFTRRGLTSQKTLLPINGRPVIEHNLLAILDTGTPVTVVASMQVAAHLRQLSLPMVSIVECPIVQPGPVASALLAGAFIDPQEEVMIFDGDQIYSPSVVPSLVQPMSKEARLVVCRMGPHPDYCAVHVDGLGLLNHLTEKGNDSDLVVAGGYGFCSWSIFYGLAVRTLSSCTFSGCEPKLSLVMELASSHEFAMLEPHEWTSVGTPEEYQQVKA